MAELSTVLENLGGYLRENRLAQRVKLEDLSARTRISVRFLEAIEANRFDLLPNPVSARGFLRAYARALLLAEEPILRRFLELQDQTHPPDPTNDKPSKPILKTALSKEPVSAPFKMGIPLGILAVIVLLIWAVSRGGAPAAKTQPEEMRPAAQETPPSSPKAPQAPLSSAPQPPPAPPASPPPSAVVPSPEPSSPPEEEEGAPAPPSPSASAEPPPSMTGEPVGNTPQESVSSPSPPATSPSVDLLVLEVEALEISWLNVQIDNGDARDVLLKPGQKVRWQARDRFLLTLGNAGGVKVSYNGKPLEPFGPSGKVVKGILLAR